MMRDHKKELRHALTDVHRVIRALGLEKGAQRQATGLTICCPWHKENTPSCSVTLGKDGTIRLRCFGCQATGDVFALIAQVHGLDVRRDFTEVLRISAELANATDILDDLDAARHGAPAPKRAPWVAPIPPAPIEVQRQSIEVYDAIISRLLEHCPLGEGEVARYLDGRGLLSLARSAGLGALPSYAEQKPIFASMVAEFGIDVLDAAGLVYGQAFSVPDARLLIPWRAPDGRIDVLERRRIDDQKPKYSLPKGRPIIHAYGSEVPFPEVDPENDGRDTAIAYVEGALDVLALREFVRCEQLDILVFGLPGVGNWNDEWAQQAQGRIAYVALDADTAGNGKAKELGVSLKRAGALEVKRLPPTGGAKDWAAAITARKGAE